MLVFLFTNTRTQPGLSPGLNVIFCSCRYFLTSYCKFELAHAFTCECLPVTTSKTISSTDFFCRMYSTQLRTRVTILFFASSRVQQCRSTLLLNWSYKALYYSYYVITTWKERFFARFLSCSTAVLCKPLFLNESEEVQLIRLTIASICSRFSSPSSWYSPSVTNSS